MHEDVFELPRIRKIEVLISKLILVVLKGVPFSVESLHWTNVVILHLKALFIVHMVRLNKTCFGVL